MTVQDSASATAAPDRSLPQRMSALAEANRIRSYRARVKDEVRAGNRAGWVLIDRPPKDILTMPLMELLLAIPKVGRVKAVRLLNSARISPSKTIGGLTDRQRTEVVGLMRYLTGSGRTMGT